MPKPKVNPKELKYLLHHTSKSCKEIAHYYGVTARTIANWRNRFGIKGRREVGNTDHMGRPPKYDESDIVQVEVLLERGHTYKEVSKETGFTTNQIQYLTQYKIGSPQRTEIPKSGYYAEYDVLYPNAGNRITDVERDEVFTSKDHLHRLHSRLGWSAQRIGNHLALPEEKVQKKLNRYSLDRGREDTLTLDEEWMHLLYELIGMDEEDINEEFGTDTNRARILRWTKNLRKLYWSRMRRDRYREEAKRFWAKI